MSGWAVHDREINGETNPCRCAIDRASCARSNACRAGGVGDGLRTTVKPASLKQESARVLIGHGLGNGSRAACRIHARGQCEPPSEDETSWVNTPQDEFASENGAKGQLRV